MRRDPSMWYYIVCVDGRTIPATVRYVTHDIESGMRMGWCHFRSSATRYSAKRDAIREAKSLSMVFPGQFTVKRDHPCLRPEVVWSNR